MSASPMTPTSTGLSQSLSRDLAIENPDAGGPCRLSHLRGAPVVLSFHAQHWDPSPADQVALLNRLLARFLGPVEPVLAARVQGIWCNLEFAGREMRIPLVSPMARERSDLAGAAGPGAVFLLDGHGDVRWRYYPPSGGAVQSSEVLDALGQLAPVIRAGAPSLTREEFVAAALAATLILSLRPRWGRAAPRIRATATL